jgi:type IV secretory pathway VirB10-like protein
MNREVELREEKDHARAISQARTGKDPRLERIKTVSFSSHEGVPAGTEAMVVLTSGGANGMVKATLSEGLKSQGDVLLPQGTAFLGSGSSSEDRLFIAFKKAILPDHSVMKIKALAYDKDDRILGVKGKRVSDYAFRLAASSGLIFLGGMADGMREEVNLNVGERRRPSVRDAALSGVATATDDVGKDMLEKMKSQDSRVEVAHSTSVLIIFDDATDN